MPQLDSLLRIVIAQSADELRLGSDKSPNIFGQGAPRRLTVPATSTSTLLELFGELLDESRRAQLDKLGRVEFEHDTAIVGAWAVTVTKRPGSDLSFDALVRKKMPPAEKEQMPKAPPTEQPAEPLAEQLGSPNELQAKTAQPAVLTAPPPQRRVLHAYRATAGLHELMVRAARHNASDLHLCEGEAPRLRVDGVLRNMPNEAPIALGPLLEQALGAQALDGLADASSLDLGFDLEGGVRARMNVYRSAAGLCAAIRFLPRELRQLSELGYGVPIDDLASLSSGLVLVTGATGSGKSTTLAALCQHALSRRSIVLISLEDPIEHLLLPSEHSLVRQRQIGRDVPSFARGLRDALREDPDVLLIGEMRDQESIALALTAAETGHLVLASMHARSASSAVERILDTAGPGRTEQVRAQLADSLRAVLAQRLITHQSGNGRVLAGEVLRVTTAVSASIRDGKLAPIRTAMQAGKQEGMLPLERSLAELVRKRAISTEEALRAASDPDVLAQYLAR